VRTREERNHDLITAVGPWKVVDHRSDASGVQELVSSGIGGRETNSLSIAETRNPDPRSGSRPSVAGEIRTVDLRRGSKFDSSNKEVSYIPMTRSAKSRSAQKFEPQVIARGHVDDG
jgi:hypothetical protein